MHTFSIPLVKIENSFFHYKNGPLGGFNLYKGNLKTCIKEKDDFEFIPVSLYSYEEISKLLERNMRKSTISRELGRKQTVAVGHYFFIDKRTLHKNKIPMLKCIVILGHKRMVPPKKKSGL